MGTFTWNWRGIIAHSTEHSGKEEYCGWWRHIGFGICIYFPKKKPGWTNAQRKAKPPPNTKRGDEEMKTQNEKEDAVGRSDLSDGLGWLPIATAPKDGTRIIGYDGGIVFASWGEQSYSKRGKYLKKNCWRAEGYGYDGCSGEAFLSLWMPEPAHPNVK